MTIASKYTYSILVWFMFLSGGLAYAEPPQNYTEAKKIARAIFSKHRQTLYCGCSFDKHGTIRPSSCKLKGLQHPQRAQRMEFEHMMPMDNITRQFECGRRQICQNKKGKKYRGRRCCRAMSADYRRIEAELYNLWPAVGSINRARSNFRFAELGLSHASAEQYYDGCELIINNAKRKVEPSGVAKGIVARANLFMSDRYDIRLSRQQRDLFLSWHQLFPADTWEKKWGSQVYKIVGYQNPYIVESLNTSIN